jgi:Short C-terminal domain/Phospholipase_D-nuclease N-terminal
VTTVHGYPLLDLFWTILYFFVWILWIFLLVRIITDIFRSPDLGGWARAGWTVLLIIFPFIGALAYLILRGSDMHTRENRQSAANEHLLRYLQQTSGPGVSTADELHKLAALRDNGVLTEEEFAAQKAKLLG